MLPASLPGEALPMGGESSDTQEGLDTTGEWICCPVGVEKKTDLVRAAQSGGDVSVLSIGLNEHIL